MVIYFIFVLLSACFSTFWCIHRCKKIAHVRKPLYEATLFNFVILIMGSIWWIISQKEGNIVVPGIIYYCFSFLIIYLINRLTLSLVMDKKLI